MASLLLGVTINQEYNNPDFGISLPDEDLSCNYLLKKRY